MNKPAFAALYSLTGGAGLYAWEYVRSLSQIKFGLYQAFLGTEGYAHLVVTVTLALFASAWLRLVMSARFHRPESWRSILPAALIWFPLSLGILLPLKNLGEYLVVLLAVPVLFPFAHLAVALACARCFRRNCPANNPSVLPRDRNTHDATGQL